MDFWDAVGWLSAAIWQGVKILLDVIVRFLETVVGWAHKMWAKYTEKIRNGWKLFYVEVDASRIPPSVVPVETLKNAKKVHLGVLTNPQGIPQNVDELFVPSSVDATTREHIREGRGAIELVL